MSTERSYVVFTAVGPDRAGLVNQISSLVHDAGANLEDSRMAILGGEFAIILLLSCPAPVVEAVKACAQRIERELGLLCTVKETATSQGLRDYLHYKLRVNGVDRPGIVLAITRVLAGRGINLASLESRVTYAPLSGTPMFVLNADLQVPSQVDLAALRGELASRCEEQNLDFTLESRG